MVDLSLVAEVLPFRTELFELCGGSAPDAWILAGQRVDRLAAFALPAALPRRIRSGSAAPAAQAVEMI